jgi:hypothetical protein
MSVTTINYYIPGVKQTVGDWLELFEAWAASVEIAFSDCSPVDIIQAIRLEKMLFMHDVGEVELESVGLTRDEIVAELDRTWFKLHRQMEAYEHETFGQFNE